MIFDKTLLFSDGQAVTADAPSTNIVDLGPIAPGVKFDIGKGKQIPIRVQVTETFDKLTSIVVSLQASADAAFTSPKTVWTSPSILAADLVAGYVFNIDYVPRGASERYIRLYYDITGTTPESGKITAGITMGNQSNG